jgi:hypothetical protein
MGQKINRLLDVASEFLAQRKGLLVMIGILMIVVNGVLQFVPGGWLAHSNLLLHLGLVIALVGIMLAWAL